MIKIISAFSFCILLLPLLVRGEIQTSKKTTIPAGWLAFCQIYSDDCDDADHEPFLINQTPAQIAQIRRINKEVNAMVEPTSDLEHWNKEDQWNIPSEEDPRADCEDIALLKRNLLDKAGFPRSALLLTVVLLKNGEHHVVLTVKTDKGDLILDNLEEKIRTYEEARSASKNRYKFLKIQADYNERIWLRITDSVTQTAEAAEEPDGEELRGTLSID